jgi:murein DD-endopeptidase MepM/ murein hydrolase activator NlpD
VSDEERYHGDLNPMDIDPAFETGGSDEGGPAPDFRLPFPCGEKWRSSTYASHGNALDWNDPAKDDGGRPIVASAPGTAFIGKAGTGYGNHVVVNHGAGWSTVYAHFRAVAISHGQQVNRGQVVGFVGSTGNSTGNHLHYEQRLNGVRQPLRWSAGGLAAGVVYTSDNCDTPAPQPQPQPQPQPPAPPATRGEQQGSLGANTFTNPYNASGMGPRIAPMQWVDVSCKVHAPQIQSANPDGYWYRIASPPWNNAYYAVANTFWNGDIPGQRPYTHNTDWAVPNC